MRLAPLPRAPFLLLLAGCALLGSPASPARADEPAAPPAASPRIVHHRIEARFEPATSRIVARDVVDVDVSTGGTFAFALWAGVDAVSMTFLDVAEGTGAVAPRRGSRAVNLSPFTASLPEGVHQVEIRYSGTMSEVPDDPHRGRISEPGIRLTGASGWYPTTTNDGPARFDVDAWVPAPFLAVTQGGIPERSSVTTAKGWTGGERIAPLAADPGDALGTVWNRCVARAVIPTDGCALFGGPYVTATREVEGIAVSTWFLPGHAADAPLWLDAAAEVVTRYESYLGTYPYPKFDVVEGVVEGTYVESVGGPSYAWLPEDGIQVATEVEKAVSGKISSGNLAPLYVRGWFGDGVCVSRADGDWSGAVTAYLGVHLAKELESPAAARSHRRGILSIQPVVGRGPEEVPVRAFQRKALDPDDARVAGKGAHVFHMLRKRLGDGEFFARVRRFAADHVGQAVGWTEWLSALDGAWTRPYLERTGLPALRLLNVSAWPAAGGKEWNVRAEVSMHLAPGAAPWPAVDLAVEVDGKPAGRVEVDGTGGVFRGTWPTQPHQIEMDPGFDTLRDVPLLDADPGLLADVLVLPDAPAGEAVEKTIRFLTSKIAAKRTEPTILAWVATWINERMRAAGFTKADIPVDFPLGVADLRSKRDLILTTANGTEVLENAFRPLFCSAERELGTPLPFGTAEGVPLPGRIPDTSPDGLARFFRQLATASPAALFVIPSPSARKGLAPFLDAPNDLTPTAEAELGKPGPDGKPRPDLRAWISARRAHAVAGPGPRTLPLPVLLLEDAAYDRLDRAPTVTQVDFAVEFGPEWATWAAGKGGTNVAYQWMPSGQPAERPPVVVLAAPYDSLGDADAGTGLACVLEAVQGLKDEVVKAGTAKRGLIVCFFDASEQGHLGSRALAPALVERFDVTAVVNVDRVGDVRDDTLHLLGLTKARALAAKAGAAFEGSGLKVGPDIGGSAYDQGGDHWPFHLLGVPAITLTTRGDPATSAPGDDASPVDPVGVARLVPVVRKLVLRLLTE